MRRAPDLTQSVAPLERQLGEQVAAQIRIVVAPTTQTRLDSVRPTKR